MSGWREEIVAVIRREAKPLEKYSHQPRLYALTRRIGKDLRYDDDVVYAAAWLHDLGVFEGHRPEELEALKRWDNTAYAMEKAPAILREAGFPEEKIAAVVEAIRTHQPSADPTAIEGVILRDADILEQIGAVGILRTVCKIGRDTRFVEFADACAALRRALDTLPALIRLEPTRRLSQPKIALLRAFLDAEKEEAAGAE